jgi:hypothetical protein
MYTSKYNFRMVLDEETVGWQGRDGVSVWVAASAEYRHVDQLKRKLFQLTARVETLREAEEKMASEREGVEAEVAAVESELEEAVAAPASGGQDPTSWLPDELLIVVLLLVPFEALWTGRCAGVCRRWRAVVESEPVKRRKRTGKWEAYAKGWVQPRTLEGHADGISCLAVGLGDTIYSGSDDCTIRVWRGGKDIRTLEGHTDWVRCLAIGPDGTVYSGSDDATVRVWSGEDGAHIRTLSGHRQHVNALAVGPNDKLYSGSNDKSIRLWSTRDGAHIQTLEGHTDAVAALLLGLDGSVYSGSCDYTIRVWSGDDGGHLQTLEGHTDWITSLAWGPDGKLYSGSDDFTIRVWSDDGATIFKTAESEIISLAWMDGNLVAASFENVWVWSSDQLGLTDPPSHLLDVAQRGEEIIAVGTSGGLYAAGSHNRILQM